MCDYSLEHEKSRPATERELLVIHQFHQSKGFVSPKKTDVAVCLLPGTRVLAAGLCDEVNLGAKGTFVQRENPYLTEGSRYHRDAIRFDGQTNPIVLQLLPEGFAIEVMQIPASGESDIAEGNSTELVPEAALAGAD